MTGLGVFFKHMTIGEEDMNEKRVKKRFPFYIHFIIDFPYFRTVHLNANS